MFDKEELPDGLVRQLLEYFYMELLRNLWAENFVQFGCSFLFHIILNVEVMLGHFHASVSGQTLDGFHGDARRLQLADKGVTGGVGSQNTNAV